MSAIQFDPFDAEEFGGRYEFEAATGRVHDTRFRRHLEAKACKGGPAYFRLVRPDGVARHVQARDIFDAGVVKDFVPVQSDFDPRDYNRRYDFDFEVGVALAFAPSPRCRKGEPLTLQGGDVPFYFLRRNDDRRIRVYPAEIRDYAARVEVWEVPVPAGHRTVRAFPDHSFSPDLGCWRIRSKDRPLVRAEREPVLEYQGRPCYDLVSVEGNTHHLMKDSLNVIFR